MVKAKITQLSESTIQIERFDIGTPTVSEHEADFYATGSEIEGLVTITKNKKPFLSISVHFSELEINDDVPKSRVEAVTALNSFIGNFNRGGGININDIKEALSEALEEALPDEIDFSTEEI